MGQLHELIRQHGIDRVREKANDKLDRKCIDAAYAVMSDDEPAIGFTHAGFAMTALPHKAVEQTVWRRQSGSVTLQVESGVGPDNVPVGLPFGAVARVLLLYFQTVAVRIGSRDVELGRSMHQWLKGMGVKPGGKTYQLVRDQFRRLSLCRLTFFETTDTATIVTNGSFVRSAILPHLDDGEGETNQPLLWQDAVKLDEGFFQNLIKHPLPLREAALRTIAHRSMAIDVYIWLAYRLHVLKKPTRVRWAALQAQFGIGFQRLRAFRATFKEALQLALAAYPEATVDVDPVGLMLHPSPPPVLERGMRRSGGR